MRPQRTQIAIPGAVLDSIRAREDAYEGDARFEPAKKRRKTPSPHEMRKQAKKDKKQRMHERRMENQRRRKEAKPQKGRTAGKTAKEAKPKKRVSFSNENSVHQIPARDSPSHEPVLDYTSWERTHGSSSEEDYSTDEDLELILSEDDSQDEEDERHTMGLIDKLKALKRQQRGEVEEEEEEEEEEDEEEEQDEEEEAEDDAMAKLKALKGKKSTSEIRIVKEDDLEEDEVSDLDSEEEEEEEEEDEDDDDEDEGDAMAKLKALKGKKSTSDIRIVKEDDLEDDEVSNLDSEEEEEEEEEDDDDDDEDEGDAMAKLKALKGKKSTSDIRIVKEDDLEDDEVSDLDGSDMDIDDEEYAVPVDENYERDQEEMDYYAKKLGLKDKKRLAKQDDDDLVGGLFDGLDFMDKYGEESSQAEAEDAVEYADPDAFADYQNDDMDYYAKKLGIDPKKGLTKQDNDDIIGGLFDGLDFMENSKQKKSQPEESKQEDQPSGSDDEINEDDFDDDDDLDEDDKALLREMYGLDDSEASDASDFDSDQDGSDDGTPKVRENPYVAPVQDEEDNQEQKPTGSRYIPPALRKKLAESGESEELKKVMKTLKGPFNKLSEPNMANVIAELNAAYNDNPRHYVNEAILKIILQSVVISTPMLESFLVLYSSALVALYKLQGVDFGAYALQTLIEQFSSMLENPNVEAQKITNLIGLIGYAYSLNLVNAKLIYDIIKDKLIKDVNELKTDLLLKLVKSCGSKLRSDDPDALKEISLELNKSIKEREKKGVETSPRTSYLVDTINNLKNNKLRNMENENTSLMINRIKKQLGAIDSNRNPDPIKVNLLDIEQVEEKGKWWLVGSAWKGNDNTKPMENDDELLMDNNDDLIDDTLGQAEPNWLELAKVYRMNTDVRRAIFVSIMSAEDYMDAFMKLEKLRLKKAQKKEILNILMHCATMEGTYNPYYSVLAKKLCDDHSMRRSLQLNLWDFIKELDGDDTSTNILGESDETERLVKIINMGRFFGFIIGEGSLSLNVLRVVNFLTVSSDVKIFLEILLITVLDTIGKKSEVKAFGTGTSKAKELTFGGKVMAERIAKCDEQPLLMKGLQYFLNTKVRKSDLVKGKKQSQRVHWGIDTMSDMIAEMLERTKDEN